MNRTRTIAATLIGLALFGAFAINDAPPIETAAAVCSNPNCTCDPCLCGPNCNCNTPPAKAIDGNSDLLPAPSTYLVACYPKDWKTDASSRALRKELGKPAVAKYAKAVKFHDYVDGTDADFEHRFQGGNNGGPISAAKLPCVIVMHKGQKKYISSGSNVATCSEDLPKILSLCRPFHPKPDPSPTPTPTPDDDRPTPDIDDTDVDDVDDTPDGDKINPLFAALCLIGGGFCGWSLVFKRGM